MIGWLQLTDGQRKASITEVEYSTGIQAKAIEKDWWVTLTLKALFRSKYAKHMVFKGGTSLSKCWKLISRFSEDIDIALAPEVFGMQYEKNPSKGYVERLKRAGCAFTSKELKKELQIELEKIGLPAGLVKIEAAEIPENRPDTDPQTLHVKYHSLYEVNPYIADEVKIEVSVRSLQVPYSQAMVQSMLFEENPSEAYREDSLLIDAVEPRKTFLEKLFLLHEEFGKPDVSRIRSERMSRHLYDLGVMTTTPIEKQALTDQTLYADIIAHRKSYQRISWVNYETLNRQTLTFVPPADVIEKYRDDYKTMREQMIYGEPPEFDELIERLARLQEKFRTV